MTAERIRKGQFCAIGERQSSTSLKDGTLESWSFTIGRVRKTDAKGNTIKEATAYRYGTEIRLREADQGRWWQSYAIRGDDMQARAGAILGQEFRSLDYLRAVLKETAPVGKL